LIIIKLRKPGCVPRPGCLFNRSTVQRSHRETSPQTGRGDPCAGVPCLSLWERWPSEARTERAISQDPLSFTLPLQAPLRKGSCPKPSPWRGWHSEAVTGVGRAIPCASHPPSGASHPLPHRGRRSGFKKFFKTCTKVRCGTSISLIEYDH